MIDRDHAKEPDMPEQYKVFHWRLYNERGDLLPHGGGTVVEDCANGVLGVAVCARKDAYSRKKGVKIAKMRAAEVLRRDGDATVGVPPMIGWVGEYARRAMWEAYPVWQSPESLALITPALWEEIPNDELPMLLGPERVKNREFRGWDYSELGEMWGISGDEEHRLKRMHETIRREMTLAMDNKTTYVTGDLRHFVRELAAQTHHTDTMLWCGLSLIEDDFTFVRYCDTLLEYMWD